MRTLLAICLLLFTLSTAAHEFTLHDMHGKTHHLSDYRGKWLLVNFWATWCAPCLEELPDLAALYQAHKDNDLMILGVAMEYPSAKVVRDFLRENPIPYPIVLGGHRVARQFGTVTALPTSYLFDPSGKLVSYHPGSITRDSVEEYIRNNK